MVSAPSLTKDASSNREVSAGWASLLAIIVLAFVFMWDLWNPGPNRVQLQAPWTQDGGIVAPTASWNWPLVAWVAWSLVLYRYWVQRGIQSRHALLAACIASYHPITLQALSDRQGHFVLWPLTAGVLMLYESSRPAAMRWLSAAVLMIAASVVDWRLSVLMISFVLAWYRGGLIDIFGHDGSAIKPLLAVGALGLIEAISGWPTAISPGATTNALLLYPSGLAVLLIAVDDRKHLWRRIAPLGASALLFITGYSAISAILTVVMVCGIVASRMRELPSAETAARVTAFTRWAALVVGGALMLYPSFRRSPILGGRSVMDSQPFVLTSWEFAFFVAVMLLLAGAFVRWRIKSGSGPSEVTLLLLLLLDLWSVSHTYYRPFPPVWEGSVSKDAILRLETYRPKGVWGWRDVPQGAERSRDR